MRAPTGVGLVWDVLFIVATILFVVGRALVRLVLAFVLLFLFFMLALFGASLVGGALVEWLGKPPETIRTGISWAMLAGACVVTLGVVVVGYRRFAFVRWALWVLGPPLTGLATAGSRAAIATEADALPQKSTERGVLRLNGRPIPWKRRTTERRK